MKLVSWLALLLLALGFLPSPGRAQEAGASLPFSEVFNAVKNSLTNMTEAELNRAAVQGFLQALHGQAVLGTNAPPSSEGGTNRAPVMAPKVFDKNYGYVRIGGIDSATPPEFAKAYETLRATNKLRGLVLDLRFAQGTDYPSAARLADQFLDTEAPLLKRGSDQIRSTAKTNAIHVPLAVLINKETSGAAEAFAAMLKETEAGLLIGNTTAGRAVQYEEQRLSNGQVLRVARAPVEIAAGHQLSSAGVQPDIGVPATIEDECVWLEDPYKIALKVPSSRNAAGVNTNRVARRGYNEAELVRRHREGLDPEGSDFKGEEGTPVLADAVLGRSLDFLKGLAMMRRLSKP